MSSRLLKELKNLSPWEWDSKPQTVGPGTLKDFEKVEECLTNRSTSRTRQVPPLRRAGSSCTPGSASLPRPTRIFGSSTEKGAEGSNSEPNSRSSMKRAPHFDTTPRTHPSHPRLGSGSRANNQDRCQEPGNSDTPLPARTLHLFLPSSTARPPQQHPSSYNHAQQQAATPSALPHQVITSTQPTPSLIKMSPPSSFGNDDDRSKLLAILSPSQRSIKLSAILSEALEAVEAGGRTLNPTIYTTPFPSALPCWSPLSSSAVLQNKVHTDILVPSTTAPAEPTVEHLLAVHTAPEPAAKCLQSMAVPNDLLDLGALRLTARDAAAASVSPCPYIRIQPAEAASPALTVNESVNEVGCGVDDVGDDPKAGLKDPAAGATILLQRTLSSSSSRSPSPMSETRPGSRSRSGTGDDVRSQARGYPVHHADTVGGCQAEQIEIHLGASSCMKIVVCSQEAGGCQQQAACTLASVQQQQQQADSSCLKEVAVELLTTCKAASSAAGSGRLLDSYQQVPPPHSAMLFSTATISHQPKQQCHIVLTSSPTHRVMHHSILSTSMRLGPGAACHVQAGVVSAKRTSEPNNVLPFHDDGFTKCPQESAPAPVVMSHHHDVTAAATPDEFNPSPPLSSEGLMDVTTVQPHLACLDSYQSAPPGPCPAAAAVIVVNNELCSASVPPDGCCTVNTMMTSSAHSSDDAAMSSADSAGPATTEAMSDAAGPCGRPRVPPVTVPLREVAGHAVGIKPMTTIGGGDEKMDLDVTAARATHDDEVNAAGTCTDADTVRPAVGAAPASVRQVSDDNSLPSSHHTPCCSALMHHSTAAGEPLLHSSAEQLPFVGDDAAEGTTQKQQGRNDGVTMINAMVPMITAPPAIESGTADYHVADEVEHHQQLPDSLLCPSASPRRSPPAVCSPAVDLAQERLKRWWQAASSISAGTVATEITGKATPSDEAAAAAVLCPEVGAAKSLLIVAHHDQAAAAAAAGQENELLEAKRSVAAEHQKYHRRENCNKSSSQQQQGGTSISASGFSKTATIPASRSGAATTTKPSTIMTNNNATNLSNNNLAATFDEIVKDVARICQASSVPPTSANIQQAVLLVQTLRNPASTPLHRLVALRQLQAWQQQCSSTAASGVPLHPSTAAAPRLPHTLVNCSASLFGTSAPIMELGVNTGKGADFSSPVSDWAPKSNKMDFSYRKDGVQAVPDNERHAMQPNRELKVPALTAGGCEISLLGRQRMEETCTAPPCTAPPITHHWSWQQQHPAELEILPLELLSKVPLTSEWDDMLQPALPELLHALLTGVKSLQAVAAHGTSGNGGKQQGFQHGNGCHPHVTLRGAAAADDDSSMWYTADALQNWLSCTSQLSQQLPAVRAAALPAPLMSGSSTPDAAAAAAAAGQSASAASTAVATAIAAAATLPVALAAGGSSLLPLMQAAVAASSNPLLLLCSLQLQQQQRQVASQPAAALPPSHLDAASHAVMAHKSNQLSSVTDLLSLQSVLQFPFTAGHQNIPTAAYNSAEHLLSNLINSIGSRGKPGSNHHMLPTEAAAAAVKLPALETKRRGGAGGSAAGTKKQRGGGNGGGAAAAAGTNDGALSLHDTGFPGFRSEDASGDAAAGAAGVGTPTLRRRISTAAGVGTPTLKRSISTAAGVGTPTLRRSISTATGVGTPTLRRSISTATGGVGKKGANNKGVTNKPGQHQLSQHKMAATAATATTASPSATLTGGAVCKKMPPASRFLMHPAAPSLMMTAGGTGSTIGGDSGNSRSAAGSWQVARESDLPAATGMFWQAAAVPPPHPLPSEGSLFLQTCQQPLMSSSTEDIGPVAPRPCSASTAAAAAAAAFSTPGGSLLLSLQRTPTLSDGLPDISGTHISSASASNAASCSDAKDLLSLQRTFTLLGDGLPDIIQGVKLQTSNAATADQSLSNLLTTHGTTPAALPLPGTMAACGGAKPHRIGFTTAASTTANRPEPLLYSAAGVAGQQELHHVPTSCLNGALTETSINTRIMPLVTMNAAAASVGNDVKNSLGSFSIVPCKRTAMEVATLQQHGSGVTGQIDKNVGGSMSQVHAHLSVEPGCMGWADENMWMSRASMAVAAGDKAVVAGGMLYSSQGAHSVPSAADQTAGHQAGQTAGHQAVPPVVSGIQETQKSFHWKKSRLL
ncbi:hypothetical protein CEUSTIGMA_g55.t1 [Chlamydomonas eustigma]|uniref:Uncharacterized protein n=1 Tax=Chlamydomonas eustigma TaxID=1157962 RepID=A0A250WPI2_9CHLO|nr:hypothetical protein CEUSTIGMA_g55.t1 [Chlamydomonas eustigma]|eukprot:GAX72599.1 hypothetical protein CEUSTIGMA_g55.t1 [Chlamydomonas eustigma]